MFLLKELDCLRKSEMSQTFDSNLTRSSNSFSRFLRRTQLRILVRAVEMLAVEGIVVYSTCSMNPVEDEAVVSQLLLRAQGVSL